MTKNLEKPFWQGMHGDGVVWDVARMGGGASGKQIDTDQELSIQQEKQRGPFELYVFRIPRLTFS